uniref:Uncharacterized protein n=1 Tax=Oryza glumipatula TaxID=40148 RepID=A0A0E0AG21_9ORYZ
MGGHGTAQLVVPREYVNRGSIEETGDGDGRRRRSLARWVLTSRWRGQTSSARESKSFPILEGISFSSKFPI